MGDDDLQLARDRVRRLDQVRRMRATVAGQLGEVEQELNRLHRVHAEEDYDVERLERRTLTSIVAGVLGNRHTRLEKERAEAELARMKVVGQESRHERLCADLDLLDGELADLADAPQRYERALAEAD